MASRQTILANRIEQAYKEIALSKELPNAEKLERLRAAYREAWFDSCDFAKTKWLDRFENRVWAVE
ncbi:MAG: hypothetical protein MI754_07400 [Chromatiales bacterium]|nr:hypothetical protein [Chromatiales bacterium]